MFRAADSDGDGYVTSEDFYNIVTKKTFKWYNDRWHLDFENSFVYYIFIYLMKKATATKTTPKKLMEPAEIKKLFAKLTSRLFFTKREIKVWTKINFTNFWEMILGLMDKTLCLVISQQTLWESKRLNKSLNKTSKICSDTQSSCLFYKRV